MSSFHIPVGYNATPPWPSLFWEPFIKPDYDPYQLYKDFSHSLYYPSDIWWFTALWAFVFSIAVYLSAGIWATITLARSRTLKWYVLPIVPIVFIVGGLIGAAASSLSGIGIAYVYNAGVFTTSTWVPFLWAFIHILTMMIGAFSTVTSIL